MIQDIEEFAAKLHFDPVVEFPDLCDREIPFVETRPAKNVASRIAEVSRRRSREYSVSGNVASTGGAGKAREIGEVRISIELIHRGLPARRHGCSYALLRLSRGSTDYILI